MSNENIKSFADFKNIYPISKTLCFSLKPMEKTAEILDIENDKKENFRKDREIRSAYKLLKEMMDEFHSEFISFAMKDFSFNLSDLKKLEEEILRTKKVNQKKEISKKEFFKEDKFLKPLESKIAKHFAAFEYKNLKLKSGKFGNEIIVILKEKHKNDKEKMEALNTFDNFFTYLGGYQENRANYYKGENKSGQFATRVVKENLLKFVENKYIFDKKYKKIHKEVGFDNVKIFDLTYFNNLFLQDGINEYNSIIGGEKNEENKTGDGINQRINEFKQKEKNRLEKEFNRSDYPFFKELYKQVGSLKDKENKFIEIDSDEILIEELNKFPTDVEKYLINIKNFYSNFFKGAIKESKFDLDKIYVPKRAGTQLSHLIFNDWQKLAGLYRKDENKNELKADFLSLCEIKENINEFEYLEFKQIYKDTKIIDGEKYEKGNTNSFKNFLKVWEYEISSLFNGGNFEIEGNRQKRETLSELKKEYLTQVEFYRNKIIKKESLTDDEEEKMKEGIKGYLDRVLDMDRTIGYFDLRKSSTNLSEEDKDSVFYMEFDKLKGENIEVRIYNHYNQFRNYLTKRNTTEDKFKLSFDSGVLLSGWDLNKEAEKFSLIFRSGGNYYLGIINKNLDKKIFDKNIHSDIFTETSNFEKMEYKTIPNIKRDLPHFSFSNLVKNRQENVGWTEEIQKIKDEFAEFQENKKNDKEKWKDEFDKKKLIKLIAYYQNVLEKHSQKYKETFGLKWKKPEEYKNLGEFNDEIERQSYKVKFIGINKNYIDEKVANGELYLFQIYNKDFSEKKGDNTTENLHTIYFKELFSKENLENPIFKLSGEADMFFRDRIEKHKEKIKKDKDGKDLKNKKGEVVKDGRRFTKNTALFHVPIVINYGANKVSQKQFNAEVNNYIKNNSKDVKIIGIDRGEKHLLYYSLLDSKGKLLEVGSLNCVNQEGDFVPRSECFMDEGILKHKNKKGEEIRVTDYHEKLDKMEIGRDVARKNWQTIEGIKNIKKGYISLVVKKIADMALKNNSIIVLEDLNIGFKQGRQKIEKNVYQQFEKALIEKLNFVVDKKIKNQRKAPQLSAPFESFEKIKKQTGIIYYVGASYTSKVCPKCNWKRNIYVHYSSVKDVIKKFSEYKLKVFYEKKEDRFKFMYTIKKIETVVYSDVDRSSWNRKLKNGHGASIEFRKEFKKGDKIKEILQEGSLTQNFKELFTNDDGFGVEIAEHVNLFEIDAVKKNTASGMKSNWGRFIYLFNRILEIRNTIELEDRIICPHCHFDSRKSEQIMDGDANGAYNIAKKGLFVINEIKEKRDIWFKDDDYNKFLEDKDFDIM